MKGSRQKELGRRIVQMRKRRGWNQAALARRLGVPRERLGKWERGLNAPSLDDLAALSEVLGVPLEELGLGCSLEQVLSSTKVTELVSYLKGMAQVLRPWMEIRNPKRAGGGAGGSKP